MHQQPRQFDADPRVLHPNPWNSNRMSPENERKLDASVKRRGMFKPIVVRELEDGQLQILGGQHRAESAVRLKLKNVPVFNLGRIDEKAAKEIGVLDNSRYGEDDVLGLAKVLEGLEVSPEELASFMPMSATDIDGIFASTNIDLDNLGLDDDVDLPPPPTQRAPQTHQLMRFKVPIGDVPSVTAVIERVMKAQKFTEEDSLSNAGNALVHVMKESSL